MNIIGLGFDATDIPRVREVFERYGDRFLRRVFTDGGDCLLYAAARSGPEPGRPVRGEGSDDEGARHRPLARRALEGHRGVPPRRPAATAVDGGALRRFDAMQARRSLLTITHSDALAMAQVLLLDDQAHRGCRTPAPSGRQLFAPSGDRHSPCDVAKTAGDRRPRRAACPFPAPGEWAMTIKIIANDKGNPPGQAGGRGAALHRRPAGGTEADRLLASGSARPATAATSRSRRAATRSTASGGVRAAAARRPTARRRTASAI